MTFSGALRSFSADLFGGFVLANKTRNIVLRDLKLEFDELWGIKGTIAERREGLFQQFSVYFVFHEFKILYKHIFILIALNIYSMTQ